MPHASPPYTPSLLTNIPLPHTHLVCWETQRIEQTVGCFIPLLILTWSVNQHSEQNRLLDDSYLSLIHTHSDDKHREQNRLLDVSCLSLIPTQSVNKHREQNMLLDVPYHPVIPNRSFEKHIEQNILLDTSYDSLKWAYFQHHKSYRGILPMTGNEWWFDETPSWT